MTGPAAGATDDRYLVAACPDPGVPGGWVFCFVNATSEPILGLTIETAGVEWGSTGWVDVKDKDLGAVDSMSALEIWTCDSDAAELNPWLTLRLSTRKGTERLIFEFPKPYRIRRLEPVPILGRPGYLCRPEPFPEP